MSIPWSKEHYHLHDGKIRWRGYEVKGAAAATFQPLNHIWARDAKRVYTQHSVNKLADRETFQVLNHIFAKDKNRIFYLSGWIKEADPKSFRVLDEGRIRKPDFARGPNDDENWNHEGFACDARSVFFDDMMEGKAVVLRGADPSRFMDLGNGYGRDDKLVFYRKSRVKGATAEQFRILSIHYATDGKRVYYMERTLADARPESFQVLADCWGCDASHAFFKEFPISNADIASFEMINDSFARDNRQVYGWTGKVLEDADPKSFERIGGSLYYRDAHGIYYTGHPDGWLEDADLASFQIGPGLFEGHDRNWHYVGTEKKGTPAG